MKIKVSKINVGMRRRDEYGDLEGLAVSIRKHGLIQPIVLDDQNRLVAGGRRLKAVKNLGWEEIEVRSVGELTDAELRELELEENLRRKDLTSYERSKNMVAYAEAARRAVESLKGHCERVEPEAHPDSTQASKQEAEEVVLRHGDAKPEEKASEELRPTVGRKSERGRPNESGSYREVEEHTGLSKSTIQRAEKHVEAVEKYPELKELPQSKAIEVGKKLDSMPEPDREKLTVGDVLAGGQDFEVPSRNLSPEQNAFHDISKYLVRLRRMDPDKVAEEWVEDGRDEFEARQQMKDARYIVEWFGRYEKAVERVSIRFRREPGNLSVVGEE